MFTKTIELISQGWRSHGRSCAICQQFPSRSFYPHGTTAESRIGIICRALVREGYWANCPQEAGKFTNLDPSGRCYAVSYMFTTQRHTSLAAWTRPSSLKPNMPCRTSFPCQTRDWHTSCTHSQKRHTSGQFVYMPLVSADTTTETWNCRGDWRWYWHPPLSIC